MVPAIRPWEHANRTIGKIKSNDTTFRVGGVKSKEQVDVEWTQAVQVINGQVGLLPPVIS